MSGLTGLLDTQLVDKLAQRVDLLHLPLASVVAGPTSARAVRPVAGEVRLQPDAPQESSTPTLRADGATQIAPGQQELSQIGQAIGALLADIEQQAAPVVGPVPLAKADADAPALAHAIASAVTTSGLFYESHLAAVADGSMSPQALLAEPQARLSIREPAVPGAHDQQSAGLSEAAGGAAGRVIPPQLRQTVSQQLALLSTGVFHWQGELWPGVPAEWHLREQRDDNSPEQPSAAEAPQRVPRWMIALTVQMPRIGRLDAHVTLSGEQVQVTITADAAAGAQLTARSEDLRRQLATSGFSGGALTVQTLGSGHE